MVKMIIWTGINLINALLVLHHLHPLTCPLQVLWGYIGLGDKLLLLISYLTRDSLNEL